MKKIIFLILFIVILIFINTSKEQNVQVQCKYFTETIFENNLLKSTKHEITQKPVAIVVPHNESVMDMTASMFSSLSEYNYDTVILLSVNHQAKKGKILLSGADFITPIGTIYGDVDSKEIIKNSLGKNVMEDNQIVQEDHSASVVMPYIKTYMPNTKVVTVLFTSKASINEMNYISQTLNELSKEKNILLLGSIDFSHYQSYSDTVKYDEETIHLINNFNIEELKLKDGRNLDSSESIGIILEYAKIKELKEINILEHRIISNSPFSNDYGSYMSIYI